MRCLIRSFWRNEDGFSILEMTIVLVVVSILIGLALKGQDLLANAQLKDVGQDVGNMRTALSTFRSTYQALPGDFASAVRRLPPQGDIPVLSGNGNGRLDNPAEKVQFWQHLALAGLVKKIRVEENPSPRFGETVPAARVGGGYWPVYEAVHGKRRLWLRLSQSSDEQTTAEDGVLTPADAWKLDRDLDDGNPRTGMLAATGETCLEKNDYRAEDGEKACVLYIALP
jgi:prepilin-type N-terminal cleavage/methylation domain-containing protein